MSIDGKNIFTQFDDVFFNVRAISIFHTDGEIESFSFIEVGNIVFKSFERYTHTCDKLEGMLYGSFLNEFDFSFFVFCEKFVRNGYILVFNLFHVDIFLFYCYAKSSFNSSQRLLKARLFSHIASNCSRRLMGRFCWLGGRSLSWRRTLSLRK